MNPGRRMLLILAAMFAAPLAISFVMYYGHVGLQPTHRVNRGDLVNPAVPLPSAALPLAGAAAATAPDFLRHKWTLVFIGDGACNERCRKALYDTRQVRLALDRDMVRVQRLFIATGGGGGDLEFLRREHPDLIVAQGGASAAPLLEKFAAADRAADPAPGAPGAAPGGSAPSGGRVYLVDPLSNLVLSYAPEAPAKGMLEDMKRLLKLSQIG